MRCPQCQAENPDQAKFCLECGAKLQVQAACPQCGAMLPSNAKFCFECGFKIGGPPAAAPPPPLPSPPPPLTDALLAEALQRLVPKELADRLRATRGHVGSEWRLVTMLFSDVKGSTAMGELVDAEDIMDIMNGAFEVLIPPVYRHGGTLARLMGDAILAFFGAPLAYENDAERAVRAALEIVAGAQEYAARLEREWGIKGFNVRVGLNTGQVVVGEVGSDLRVEYTAMGDAINLAARMEQNAPVGGVLIAHGTYLQVRGLFEVQALEPIAVKGKAEPVRVYVVHGARPRAFRMATRGVEGIETRMIGREGELKRLQDAFYVAAEDGECQVATVVGDAGVGKTRLLWEFENWLAEEVREPIRTFHARASQELKSVPYALLRDLFVLRFDIQDSDPGHAVRAKLEAGIGRVLGLDEQGRMKAHLIGQLLGFDFGDSPHLQGLRDDARQLRDRALVYLGDFLRTASVTVGHAYSPKSTAVVLLEDIQWADDSSLDAVGSLTAALANQRLLIVCLARPTLFDGRPHWGEGQAHHTRIDLQPLSRRDSRRLVDDILQKIEFVPPALRDLVVSGSEGNPLYVEELIKVLIEQGVVVKQAGGAWRVDEERLAGLKVPPTLTGVLQARLDSLPLAQRAIVQQAAVVGRTFWDLVVIRIGERSGDRAGPDGREQEKLPGVLATLATLRGRELVAQHETSAFEGSQEFIFKHAALREVAYQSILKKVRRGYHSLVADWLIEQSGERAAEYTGLIGEHLELAGRAEEALDYLRQAAEQAAAQYANGEAVEYYTRALALLDDGAPRQGGPGRPEGGARRAADRVEWEPRRAAEARLSLLLGREEVYWQMGRREAQPADLEALRELAEELDDASGQAAGRRAEVARRQARYLGARGQFAAALASARDAVRWAEEAGDPAGETQARVQCGIQLWKQHQLDEARGALGQALDLARQHDNRLLEALSLHNLGTVAYLRGDYPGALDHMDRALSIRRALGQRRDEAMTLNNRMVVYLNSGDYARAQVDGQQTLVCSQAIADQRGEASALGNLGLMDYHVGELDAAREMQARALGLARRLGDRSMEAAQLSNLGHTLLDLGDAEAARAHCEQATALNRETGDRNGLGFSLTHLAFAFEALPDGLDAAAATYHQALCLRRELGQEAPAIDDLAGLAGVAWKQGRAAEALAQAREALGWLAARGAGEVHYPVRDYMVCAEVLAAAGHKDEAAAALAAARALVRERAEKISDPGVHASFLEKVALHARLLQDEP